jgi:hypothetical protein
MGIRADQQHLPHENVGVAGSVELWIRGVCAVIDRLFNGVPFYVQGILFAWSTK